MGKKNRKNKAEQRQVSQPPTDTSEATQEHSECINESDLLSDVGTSNSNAQLATMIGPRAVPNIGWGATPAQHSLKMNYDTNLSRLCKAVGTDGYHYMAFPVGGLVRATYQFPEDPSASIEGIPPLKLPDVQFDRYLWETYITGTISPWIDTDNPNETRASASINALRMELKHAAYLGLRTVIVPVNRINCKNLLRVVNHFLWIAVSEFNIVLLLPSNKKHFLDHEDMEDDDIFNFWITIRSNLKNYHSEKLSVGLKLVEETMDAEFNDSTMYSRWNGEPLNLFVLTAETFKFVPSTTNLNSKMDYMSVSHKTLITDLCTAPDAQKFLVAPDSQIWPVQRKQIAEYLTPIITNAINSRQLPSEENWDITLNDRLLLPMETIWRDLSSTEYDSMESDKCKYNLYGEALTKVLQSLSITFNHGIVIYILGAGRGGLISVCMEVIKNRIQVNLHNLISIIAVEKNPHAVMSMSYKNESLWHRKVRIIEGDMRFVLNDENLPKADIIVSELLGSFGDNELAPECWQSSLPILKESTECIPFQFGTFAAPICSPKIRDQLRDSFVSVFDKERAVSAKFDKETGRFNYWRPKNWYDHVFVCPMKRFYEVAPPQHIAQFKFPKLNEDLSNDRHTVVKYDIKHSCEINGFAGYFAAVLANEVFLSNSSHFRKGRITCSRSWFPCYIPLRDGIHVKGGTELMFYFWRKTSNIGTWYEWRVEYTVSLFHTYFIS
uniref:Protein arginine N-methyltransferase n=1 Tax=Panagrolaimus superbus TaxID=310955 RepID=A0A914ZAG4_9BILA